MSQSIMPRGIKTVNGVAYIGLYIPVDGRSIIARKMAVPNGFGFEFCTLNREEEYQRIWEAPESGNFADVSEVDANLAVLCNQLSVSTTSAPLTEQGLHAHPIHVILDNPAGQQDGMARDATLTDGSQKTQVINFPPTYPVTGTFWQTTQPVSGPATDAQLRATPLPVSVTFPGVQAIAGTVNVGNFPAPVTSISINNLPASQPVTGAFFQATQPVSGPLTDAQLRASALPVSLAFPASQAVTGAFYQATQPVSGPLTDTQLRATPVPVSGFPTTYPVTGTFWQATQPVSLAAVPLPAGASTATLQGTTNTTLAAIQAAVTTPALPSGSSTAALQTTGNASLASIDLKLTAPLAVSLATGASTSAAQLIGNTSANSIDNKLTGVSTAAKQDAGNASVASIDTKLTGVSTAALQTAGNALLQTIAGNTGGAKATGLPSRVVVASAVGATPTVVKNGPGVLYHLGIGNISSSVVYVSIYNKATAPVTNDIPVEIHPIPANSYISIDYPLGGQYTTGVALTITSNLTLLGVLTGLLVSNQVVVNVAYS